MEKIDPSLNLALWLAENNMVQNESLQYGYDAEKKLWTVIVKHIGEIRYIEDAFPGTRVVELFNQYAIITTSAQNLLLMEGVHPASIPCSREMALAVRKAV